MGAVIGQGKLGKPPSLGTVDGYIDHMTTAAVQEKAKLRRHFGRFDILFFLLCTLVGVDTIGSAASKGPQAFTWLIFLGIAFFIPYAFLTAELGAAFTEEGGSYVWTRLAFGRFVGALNAVIYWVSNPIWLGGSLCILAVTTFSAFFITLQGFWQYAFAFVFIWVSVLAAILSFRIGKWIPTIGAWTRISLMSVFTFSVIIYALKHGVHGFGTGDFAPSYTTFIAVVPVLIFNYVGFELPSAAGDEMENAQRDVPYTVLRSAIGTILLYGAPILSILLVLPQSQVTGLSGFMSAAKAVFSVYGGSIAKDGTVTLTGLGLVLGDLAAIGFILALLSSGTTWIMGADRAQAVASYDGAGPRVLGSFSATFGTPVAVNVCSGLISTVIMICAYAISNGDANRYFNAGLNLAISTTTISYLAIFPALIKLRYSHPEVPRPYKVPFGMAGVWFCGVITTLWIILTTIVLLWPGFGTGWFGTPGTADDALAGLSFQGQRLAYELSQFVPLGVLFVMGILFYIAGRSTRARTVDTATEKGARPAR